MQSEFAVFKVVKMDCKDKEVSKEIADRYEIKF
jgi:hypothetical protein